MIPDPLAFLDDDDPLDPPPLLQDRLDAEREQAERKRRLAGLTVLRQQQGRAWAETLDVLRGLGIAGYESGARPNRDQRRHHRGAA